MQTFIKNDRLLTIASPGSGCLSSPEIVAWEFDGDKIKRIRTVSDRLLIAQQAAKGWLPKLMVKSIINQFNKGLN